MRELEHSDLMWSVRRLPAPVESMLKCHADLFLAGGFIRSTITGEEVQDIDLFSSSKERAESLAQLLANTLQPTPLVYRSDNAIGMKVHGLLVQFIHRWAFATPQECVQSFDFTIARAAIWYQEQEWRSVCDDRYYADLAAKRIVYCHPVRNEDAGGSMLRLLKFCRRGYSAPLKSTAGIIARLLTAVDMDKLKEGRAMDEEFSMRVILGLLKMVDPNSISVDRDQ